MKKNSLIFIITFFSILSLNSCYSGAYDLKINKKVFAPGEKISITFVASPDWTENAWIGIVPSKIEHGKESTNDLHDIAFQYLNKQISGTLVFSAPEEPGKYDFRMNDSDDASVGIEITYISFEVK